MEPHVGGRKDPPALTAQITVTSDPRSGAVKAPICRFPFNPITCGTLDCTTLSPVSSTFHILSASYLCFSYSDSRRSKNGRTISLVKPSARAYDVPRDEDGCELQTIINLDDNDVEGESKSGEVVEKVLTTPENLLEQRSASEDDDFFPKSLGLEVIAPTYIHHHHSYNVEFPKD
uniref:Uncharacterized protein n=1 Tax=Timema bartmani TaxID=61472 RepID=A0A7R9F8E2_9NEOP|nr:unnamed protein product [Timema bartmani]